MQLSVYVGSGGLILVPLNNISSLSHVNGESLSWESFTAYRMIARLQLKG